MSRKSKIMVVRLDLSADQAEVLKMIARQTCLSVSEVVTYCMSNEIANFTARQDAAAEMKG